MKIVINLARKVNERRYLGARIVVKRTNYRNLLTISPPKSCVSHGARFSIVPIINGPVKLFLFTGKIEVSIVLHLT